jgi:RND family efflux transporter MFP subunit
MKYQRGLVCISVGLIVSGFSSCNGPQEPPAVSAAAPAILPSAAAAPLASRPQDFSTSGPLVVENQLEVQSLRDGVIQQIRADVGSRVQKGELLAQLDDRQITADRNAAAAKVKSIAADVSSWEYDSRALKADLDRTEAMYKANLTTKEALEHAQAKYEEDGFEVEREKANLINAQETLESLNFELEKTRIVAPFAGVVARRYVRVGQKVATGDRLFWVTATAPLRVRFTLPDSYVGQLRKGQRLQLTISGFESHAEGKVISVSPVVDAASGTIEAVAELSHPGPELRPGMTATIHLPQPR